MILATDHHQGDVTTLGKITPQEQAPQVTGGSSAGTVAAARAPGSALQEPTG